MRLSMSFGWAIRSDTGIRADAARLPRNGTAMLRDDVLRCIACSGEAKLWFNAEEKRDEVMCLDSSCAVMVSLAEYLERIRPKKAKP